MNRRHSIKYMTITNFEVRIENFKEERNIATTFSLGIITKVSAVQNQ